MSGVVVRPPWVLESSGGLRAVLVDGGAPASLGTDRVELVQHSASAFAPALVQLWLRDRATGRSWPMLGAGSGSAARTHEGALVVTGRAGGGLGWRVVLTLDPTRTAWAWHVEVRNDGPGAREVDVVHTHDVALAAPGMLRTNELYVSQYLDIAPLHGDGFGTALAVRQNLAQSGMTPWCVLACTTPVVAWATDAIDVHGLAARAGLPPEGLGGDLPSRRRQHEHTLAALQTERQRLEPGQGLATSFAGLLVADHPDATSDADVRFVHQALDLARTVAAVLAAMLPEPETAAGAALAAPTGAYDPDRTLAARPVTDAEVERLWPRPWRAVERREDGTLLSFFTADDEHVVTRAKEVGVLRPHGTILRTGDTAAPDPRSLTVTCWMTGSPLSYLTRGNASDDRVLTTVRGYLGLHPDHGVRVFVEVAGRWRLLDLPSAFAMTPDGARWVHVLYPDGEDAGGVLEVRTTAATADHTVRMSVRVTSGPQRRVLLALHLATGDDPLPAAPGMAEVRERPDGIAVALPAGTITLRSGTPLTVGDDGPLFGDGESRGASVVTLWTGAGLGLDVEVTVDPAGAAESEPGPDDREDMAEQGRPGDWWPAVTALRVGGDPGSVARSEAEALDVSLPWLVRDALVHFLSPRGLEQYSGGAWGTRDVTQGPVELLLALDRQADVRALLLRILAAQNTDGTWPQAFGFLPGDEDFRMEPPHGDVVHWPVLAVGRYLQASGDATLLDEKVPWYAPADADPGPPSTVRTHVERALEVAREHFLPGTHLVAYGHGDWNDSLQPADPAMAVTMCSSWTVTLHHQSLRTLADGLETVGGEEEFVGDLRAQAAAVAGDLKRHLLVDGELAGYARLEPPDQRGQVAVTRLLVHPRDGETGLRHGSLQMIHALGDDLLDPVEAAHHVALVREHLMGVDGVRLFDRPPPYSGGLMSHFQRAETATFVGREIGLMYVHAHLRWCEAMARWGDADALWLGLMQVLPPATVDVVPGARRRQANTYPSSSDAACHDRVEFAARYAEVLTGATGLEGGWRVYSSGPGVLLRIVVHSVLGVRRRAGQVEIDPVLPARLDGLTASVPLAGGLLRVRYRVAGAGHGPSAVRLGGRDLPATRSANPYRRGGLVVELADLEDALLPGGDELEVVVPGTS
ncbi:MAG TPA: cellobiose phosphorylase [Ornithinibacter sp.]|nr:cellobiose phosphorylase [Ornithinibacter sp.]